MNENGNYILGTVIEIRQYGALLSFEDGSKGLLHISEISEKYIRNIEHFFNCGDQINVLVLSKDPKDGFYRVSLKRVPEKDRVFIKAEKTREEIDEKKFDFEALKNKLPQWINDEKEKHHD